MLVVWCQEITCQRGTEPCSSADAKSCLCCHNHKEIVVELTAAGITFGEDDNGGIAIGETCTRLETQGVSQAKRPASLPQKDC